MTQKQGREPWQEYAAYDVKTDELLGIGYASELAELLGRPESSIYASISRAQRNVYRPKHRGIVFEKIDSEDDYD